jgi:pimeloyl-ACP methyl ester carboxylesterase
VPTLCGLGERSAEASEKTDLAVHVGDVVRVLDEQRLSGVVLVGHSYGGAVITGAAHARPERVAQLVYLDACVPADGETLAEVFGPELVARAREAARRAGTPFLVPPLFPMEEALGVGLEAAALHAQRLTPHPLASLFDPLRAAGKIPARRTYIRCSARSLGLFDRYAEAARASADWRYFELPSPHDAVYAMPAVVAGILEHLATETEIA